MEVFEYIEKKLKRSKSKDFSSWHGSPEREYYDELSKMKLSPVMRFNGVNYMITEYGATSGKGGMDQGSPHTIAFTVLPEPVEVEDLKPTPVDKPDFKNLIKTTEIAVKNIAEEGYSKDHAQYIFQEAMMAIYGENFFKWYNNHNND